MAIEVAAAYMPVIPSMKGLKKGLTAGLPDVNAAGTQMGRSLSSRIAGGLKTGMKVGAVGVGAVLGTALVKGFGRLSAIENAEAKLKGLGNSGADTAKILDDALISVKGTAFGMDEAATTAASAVAAGVGPGEELQKYLGLVGDAATIAGTDMSSMGSIFNKVMTSGKVQGDIFAQLSDSGIPVVQMLADEMGVSAEQVYEMGSAGEISSEQFLAAMGSMEGAALKGGETTTGAFKNMMAALSRLGAGLLKGVFPLIGPMFNTLTGWIDVAEEKLTPLIESVSVGLFDGLSGVWNILAKGDFTGPIFGLEEDSKYVGYLFDLREGAIGLWDILARGDFTGPIFGMQEDHKFIGFLFGVRGAVQGIWASLKTLDFSSWQGFLSSVKGMGGGLAPAFGSIGESLVTLRPAMASFMDSLPKLGGAVGTLAVSGINLLADVLAFLADHVDTIIRFMPVIVAGFVAWRVATMALTASSQKLQWAQVAMAPVLLANNALRLVNILLENRQTAARLANTAATTTNTGATAANNTAQNGGVLAKGRAVIATVAHRIATVASTVATKAATVATRALNLALRMNPIGLVIMGLVALGAAVVIMYNRVGWFKDGVQAAWSGIKTAAAGVATWFMTHVWPVLTSVLQWIGDKFVWLYQNAVLPAWNWIKGVIAGFVTWFTTTALPWIQNALTILGNIFTWLWRNIVQPVWTGIRIAVAIAAGIIITIFQGVMWVVRNVLGPVFTWLYHNVVKPVFAWIVNAAKAWWGGLQIYFNLVKWIIQHVVAPIVRWLYNNIFKPNFEAIGRIVKFAWENVIRPTFNALKQGATWVGDRFNALRDRALRAWSDLRLQLLLGWQKIQANVFNPLKQGASWVADRFSAVRDRIRDIWARLRELLRAGYNYIRDSVFTPLKDRVSDVRQRFSDVRDRIAQVWRDLRTNLFDGYTAIKDRTLNPLRDAIRRVEDTVGSVVEGVRKQWDKLKDAFKGPIKFFIERVYNEGLVKNVNDVLSLVGLKGKHLKPMEVPSGFARGGVIPGYQRAKKDDRLIPMRSGEGVLVPEVVRGIGADAVHALNTAGNTGGVGAVRNAWAGLRGLDDPEHMAGAGTIHFGGQASFASGNLSNVDKNGRLYIVNGGVGSTWQLGNAIKAWNDVGILDVLPGSRGNMQTPNTLARSGNFGRQWAGYWQASGGVNQDNIWLDDQGAPPTGNYRPVVTMHEIGHALGLRHAHRGRGENGDGTRSIMNYETQYQDGRITSGDVAALKKIYPQFANANSAKGGGGSAGNADEGERLSFVMRPIRSFIDGIAGRIGGEYPGNIASDVAIGVGKNVLGEGIFGWAGGLVKNAREFIDDLFGGGDGEPSGKGVMSRAQVEEVATRALNMKGLFSSSNLAAMVTQAKYESNWNPDAVQTVRDVNWPHDKARGLWQVIPSTFATHKEPGRGNIFAPLDNGLAAINRVTRAWGSITGRWPTKGGYALGGIVDDKWDDPVGTVHALRPGVSSIYNGTGSTELFQRVEAQPNGSTSDFTRAIELLEQIANADRDITVEVGGKAVFEAQESYKRSARIR